MQTRIRVRSRRSNALAALELSFCLPILTMFVVSTLDLGRAMEVGQILTNSAREAGRQASIGALTNAQITQVVTSFLADQGVVSAHLSVTITDLTTSGATPISASGGDLLKVVVTVPTADVLWVQGVTSAILPSQITAQTTWCAIRGPN